MFWPISKIQTPGPGLVIATGLDRLGDADRIDHLRGEHAARGFYDTCAACQAESSKPGAVPACHFLLCVVLFAVVFVVGADRAVRGQVPALVADDSRHRPVVVFDVHLQEQFGIAERAAWPWVRWHAWHSTARCPG